MNKIKTIIFSLLVVAFVACKPTEPPAPYTYETNPKFTWGFAGFYGNYYQNYDIENNVVTLNLFTEKLVVNKENLLEGVGQYLIIEDIFSAPSDTLLPVGEYKVAETGEPFTFYGGKKFEDNRDPVPSGAYIHYIETDPTKSKIAYITDGTMNIRVENDTIYSISCDFILDEKTELKGTFNSVLYHIDRVAETPPSKVRNPQYFPIENSSLSAPRASSSNKAFRKIKPTIL